MTSGELSHQIHSYEADDTEKKTPRNRILVAGLASHSSRASLIFIRSQYLHKTFSPVFMRQIKLVSNWNGREGRSGKASSSVKETRSRDPRWLRSNRDRVTAIQNCTADNIKNFELKLSFRQEIAHKSSDKKSRLGFSVCTRRSRGTSSNVVVFVISRVIRLVNRQIGVKYCRMCALVKQDWFELYVTSITSTSFQLHLQPLGNLIFEHPLKPPCVCRELIEVEALVVVFSSTSKFETRAKSFPFLPSAEVL